MRASRFREEAGVVRTRSGKEDPWSRIQLPRREHGPAGVGKIGVGSGNVGKLQTGTSCCDLKELLAAAGVKTHCWVEGGGPMTRTGSKTERNKSHLPFAAFQPPLSASKRLNLASALEPAAVPALRLTALLTN